MELQDMRYPAWSQDEDRIITDHYLSLNRYQLAEMLPGRTPAAISTRAQMLGVKKRTGGHIPECHPDRPYHASGLCKACYLKRFQTAYANSEKGKERTRRYRQSEKGRAAQQRQRERQRQAVVPLTDKEIILEFARDLGYPWTITKLRSRRKKFNATEYPSDKLWQIFRELEAEGLVTINGSRVCAVR